jgi:hypothetical protein
LSEFSSLEQAIAGWEDKPRAELPDGLPERIEGDLEPWPVGRLLPKQRVCLAGA